MDLQDRIIYSDEEMMLALNTALERTKSLRYDSKYRDTLGEDFVKKLDYWETQIRKRKDDPFTVVVVGDFKRGKSTLINALLGENVVTTDVTTETVTLNRIRYGVHTNEAVLANSRRAQLTDSELKREELEKVLADLGEPVVSLEMKRPIDLLKTVTIIDTPGTGDAMRDFSNVVQESLLQADAVIFVFSVRFPLSLAEQMFLKSSVIPQKNTSLFMVGNFTDALGDEESYSKMKSFVENKVGAMLPGAKVYMVSALDEMCLQTGRQRRECEISDILAAQFADLRKDLNEKVESKKDTVLLDRMQRLTSAMINDLFLVLNAKEKGLNMSRQDAAQALSELKEAQQKNVEDQTELMAFIERQVDSMRNETKLWMTDFIDRIAAQTKTLESESNDTLRKYYELYCVDLMQAAIETCVNLHQNQLFDLLGQISSDISQRMVGGFEELPQLDFRFHLDNRIWTKGDTAGLVVSMIPAGNLLTSVASLAADGISGLMRAKEAEKKKPDLLSQISEKILKLPAAMTETVNKIYSSLSETAKGLIAEYSEEKKAEEDALLNEAIAVSVKENEEKEEIRKAISFAKDLLNDVYKESMPGGVEEE